MTKAHIAVVYLPGNNTEEESIRALHDNGLDATLVRWNQLEGIEQYDGYFIIGGWAYEDRIRAGVIGSKDPIIQKVKKEAEKSKPVLGVCNGAQVLVESGMIPGLTGVDMALAPNNNPLVNGYYCSWVHIKNVQAKGRSVFTTSCDQGQIMAVPVAHGEGRFMTSDPAVMEELKKNNQILFSYCDGSGVVGDAFPINPNGSTESIAGICNKEGNVMAMMPHPERGYLSMQSPHKLKEKGKFTAANVLFESFAKHFEK